MASRPSPETWHRLILRRLVHPRRAPTRAERGVQRLADLATAATPHSIWLVFRLRHRQPFSSNWGVAAEEKPKPGAVKPTRRNPELKSLAALPLSPSAIPHERRAVVRIAFVSVNPIAAVEAACRCRRPRAANWTTARRDRVRRPPRTRPASPSAKTRKCRGRFEAPSRVLLSAESSRIARSLSSLVSDLTQRSLRDDCTCREGAVDDLARDVASHLHAHRPPVAVSTPSGVGRGLGPPRRRFSSAADRCERGSWGLVVHGRCGRSQCCRCRVGRRK